MTPKVPDYGHRYADKKLAALIRRLHLSYRQASLNLQEKITAYMEQFEKEDAKQRALYDSGELNHEDYMSWRYRKIAGTNQWRAMLEQLTTDLVNQDKIAASMINDTLPEVYAENHNYGTYKAEVGSGIDTTYTLYDRDTVARLVKGQQVLLPEPSVNVPKDKRWNRQHIQSSILQGILTGESMKGIADRLQNVVGMDERSAIRNARTAVTGAENAGRIDSYKRAQSMGIRMKQVWMATLDGRTRDSHAMMDGEKVDPGEKFSNGCRYPGDPEGAPAEIYNCRCTLVAEVDGSDAYNGASRPSEYLEELNDWGISYDKWKQMHGDRFYSKLFNKNNLSRNGIIDLGSEAELSRSRPGSNEQTIVSEIVGTAAYAEKMRKLGETKKIANIMTFQARKTLWRRNGTSYEDLIFIDPQTGKWRAQRGQNIEGGVSPTEKMKEMAKANPKGIIGIHNHPSSMLPSYDDLVNASRHYKYGVVLCHNGTVIKYSVSKNANIGAADQLLNFMQNKFENGEDLSDYYKMLDKLGIQMEIL